MKLLISDLAEKKEGITFQGKEQDPIKRTLKRTAKATGDQTWEETTNKSFKNEIWRNLIEISRNKYQQTKIHGNNGDCYVLGE